MTTTAIAAVRLKTAVVFAWQMRPLCKGLYNSAAQSAELFHFRCRVAPRSENLEEKKVCAQRITQRKDRKANIE